MACIWGDDREPGRLGSLGGKSRSPDAGALREGSGSWGVIAGAWRLGLSSTAVGAESMSRDTWVVWDGNGGWKGEQKAEQQSMALDQSRGLGEGHRTICPLPQLLHPLRSLRQSRSLRCSSSLATP